MYPTTISKAAVKLAAATLLSSLVLVGILWLAWWAKGGERAVADWIVTFFVPAWAMAIALSSNVHHVNSIVLFGAQVLQLFVVLLLVMYAVSSLRRALSERTPDDKK